MGNGNGKFSINAKTFYITIPRYTECPLLEPTEQSDLTLETLLRNFIEYLKSADFSPKGAILARELHKDGTPHAHLAVWLNKKKHCADFGNLVGTNFFKKSVHIGHIKHDGKCVNYTKKDKTFVTWGDVPNISTRKSPAEVKGELIRKFGELKNFDP